MAIVEAIAAQIALQPDKIAATDSERSLTFRQVGEASDDLAHRLYAL